MTAQKLPKKVNELSDVTAPTVAKWIADDERFEAKWCAPYLYLRFRKVDKFPAWRFRCKFNGKELAPVIIGKYPSLSLADARKETKKLYARVVMGYDVVAEKSDRIKSAIDKRDAEKNAYTVEKLANEYFDRQVVGRIKNSHITRRHIDKDIKPIHHLKVEDVKPKHIDDILQKIVNRNAPTTANDVLRLVKKLFSYAVKRHVIEFNPASNFDISDAGGEEKSRKRYLNAPELAQLFANMRQCKPLGIENALTIKLLLALCVRKQELTMAKWDEFNLDDGLWNLPAIRTKTDAAICIPLAPPVVEWLQELKLLAGASDYVLPARKLQKTMIPHINHSTINRAVVMVQEGIEHFTVHDFRRTARTLLADITTDDVAEKCLNHNRGTYNRNEYFEKRKAALATLADLLVQYETQGHTNVILIKTKLSA